MNLGTKIKAIRKANKLSQKVLCDGICTQGMISQIENNIHIPNIELLSKLCGRLQITLNELDFYSVDEISDKKKLFKELSSLFYERKYREIYKQCILLETKQIFITLQDKQLLKLYNAMYYGYELNDFFKAYETLEEALGYTYNSKKKNLSYEEILIMSNLAIFAYKLGMHKELHEFIDYILIFLKTSEFISDNKRMTLIFFNIANIYSRLGDYNNAIAIAQMGIDWANKSTTNTQIRLSYLYYEKAYNEQKLNIEAYKQSYKIAYYLALNNNDDFLMNFIKSKIRIEWIACISIILINNKIHYQEISFLIYIWGPAAYPSS